MDWHELLDVPAIDYFGDQESVMKSIAGKDLTTKVIYPRFSCVDCIQQAITSKQFCGNLETKVSAYIHHNINIKAFGNNALHAVGFTFGRNGAKVCANQILKYLRSMEYDHRRQIEP